MLVAALLTVLAQTPAEIRQNQQQLVHFALAVPAAVASYAMFIPLTDDRPARLVAGIGGPIAVGFGRELTQALQAGRWGNEHTADMVVNVFGALVGGLIAYAVDRNLGGTQ